MGVFMLFQIIQWYQMVQRISYCFHQHERCEASYLGRDRQKINGLPRNTDTFQNQITYKLLFMQQIFLVTMQWDLKVQTVHVFKDIKWHRRAVVTTLTT